MCGICGYVNVNARRFDAAPLSDMTDILSHRGPDGRGAFVDRAAGVALGHRRLKVLDLSVAGDQPMTRPEADVWITYNGETYNFPELRAELEARGWKFKSRSDTEVVLTAYLEYGLDFVHRLVGDFAMAIWDGRTRKLHLLRDRLGVRPLYFALINGIFFFASEIKSLLCHPLIKAKLNRRCLGEFIGHLFVSGEDTLYQGIKEVMPGERITWVNGKISKEIYFDFSFKPEIRARSLNDQRDEFSELLDDAVNIRMRADAPIGFYLSGGIDSTTLLARAAKSEEAGLKSATLAFAHYPDQEHEYSEIVAQRFATNHQSFLIDEEDYPSLIDTIIRHHDEPVPQPVAIPQYLLAMRAKPFFDVAISGSGGDELFAGYNHYIVARSFFENREIGDSEDGDKGTYHQTLRPEFIAGEFKSCSQMYLVECLTNPQYDYREVYAAWFQGNDYPDFLSRMLYMDVKTHLVAMMNKDDKMNMAAGVEGRFPFLDHRVVDYALSMSVEAKLDGPRQKVLLKDMLLSDFSSEFVEREKTAFATPMGKWFTGHPDFLDFKSLSEHLGEGLHLPSLMRLVDEYRRGGMQHQRRLWGMYGLQRWLDMEFA